MKHQRNSKFDEAVERAERGEFREYWLQLYIKENYKKLGFDSLEGPFDVGYDFKGVYKGKKVTVEAERCSSNFIRHGHNPKEVDILIVLNDDCDDPRLRKHLPKKIIKVDPEDFVKQTHDMRKEYAIKKREERKILINRLPFLRVKKALSTLYNLLVEETRGQEAGRLFGPEADAFEEALDQTALEYLNTYHANDYEELNSAFTKIELLANDLIKSRRRLDDLTSEEKEFLKYWLHRLHKIYMELV